MTKSIIDIIGRDEALKLMGDAIAKAVAESDAAGLPRIEKTKAGVQLVHQDGSVERYVPGTGQFVAREPAARKKTYSRAA